MASLRNMVRHRQRRLFEVGPYVESGCADVRNIQARSVERSPFRDANERLDKSTHLIWPTDARTQGSAGRCSLAFECRSQPKHLGDSAMQRRIIPQRNDAGQGGVGGIGNDVGEIDQHRCVGAGQEGECRRQDTMLERGIIWSSERSSERELTVEHSRRPSSFCLGANRADGNGGNAGLLKDMGERTHGARAKGSNGRK